MASREKKLVGSNLIAFKKDADTKNPKFIPVRSKKFVVKKTAKLTTGKQDGIVRKLGRPPKCKDDQGNIVRAKKRIWKHRPKLALDLGRPRKTIKKSVDGEDVPDLDISSSSASLGLSPLQSNDASGRDIQDASEVENKQQPTNTTGSAIQNEPAKVKKRFKKRISTIAESSLKLKKIRAKVAKPDGPGVDSTDVGVPSLGLPKKKLGRPSLKLKSSISTNVLPTVNLDAAKNGPRLKVRASPYTTRSGVPPQLLRNGKRRKFKEPMGAVEAQTLKAKRRRRLLSTTTDGSNVDSLSDPFVEDRTVSRIGSESDSSFLDSYQTENGTWDSDIEMKPLEVFSKEGIADTSKPYINGEPSKCKRNSTETGLGNYVEKLAESKMDPLIKKSKLLRNGDEENEVFDFVSSVEPNTIDDSPKTDSNSNLCEINNLTEESMTNEPTSRPTNITPIGPKLKSKVLTKKLMICKGEKLPVGAEPSAELTPSIPIEGTSKNFTSVSLTSEQLERAGSPNSISTGTDRALTPSEHWDTLSVTSTPSSKNFDVSFDDISEKDTDCENGKDIRRSQRSSIRKSRAALLRLATKKKRLGKVDKSGDSTNDNIQLAIGGVFISPAHDDIGLVMKDIKKVGDIKHELNYITESGKKKSLKENIGKADKSGGSTDDIQIAIGGVFISPAHDDIGLVMKDIKKVGEINSELNYITEGGKKKSLKENVNNVIENQGSLCSVAKVIESVVDAQVGGTIMPEESKPGRKTNLVKKKSLKAIERRRRVKSLNSQDIVHLVQNDLCTLKDRRASDFGLSISDNSTVPQNNEKSNKPRKYKLKRTSGVNTAETSKAPMGKSILDSGFATGLLVKTESVLQGNTKFNKPRKYKLKRLTEMNTFDKIKLKNRLAGGSKSESAKTCRGPSKIISLTGVGSGQTDLFDSLPLGRKSSSPGPAGKAFLKTKKAFPRMLASTTADDDIMVIGAKLLKNGEAEDSISKLDFKKDTKMEETETSPIKSASTLDNLQDEDMAEKLRELSKKIESEPDMFPSLYVKPLIPLCLKMEPNENVSPLKKEPKIKIDDTPFTSNKSMPVLKKEKRIEDIVSESKEIDLKVDDGPPRMEKMAVECPDSVFTPDPSDADVSKMPINLASSTKDTFTSTNVEERNEKLPAATLEKSASVAEPLVIATLLVDKSPTVQTKEKAMETNVNAPCADANVGVVEQLLQSTGAEVLLPVSDKEKECSDKEKERSDKEKECSDKEKECSDKEKECSDKEKEQSDNKKERSDKEKEQSDKEKELSDEEKQLGDEEKQRSNKELTSSSCPAEEESTHEKEEVSNGKDETTDKEELTVSDKLKDGEINVPASVQSSESVPIDNLDHLENITQDLIGIIPLHEDEKLEEVPETEAQSSDPTSVTQSIVPGKQLIEEETPENMAVKETILSALGLLSLEAAKKAKIAKSGLVRHMGTGIDNNYTGTLKTIIKVQRSPEKRTRPLKMILKNNKPSKRDKGDKGYDDSEMNGFHYSICKDAGPSTDDPGSSSNAGVGNRKCLKPSFSYRSYFDISSNPQLFVEDVAPIEPVEQETEKEGEKKQLVIPEKASSFSIHPGRLCSDVCSYCFGKFGSLDTPCHVAQLKGSERQVNILKAELHLTADSCLCDACYRHVDRKANCPTYREKTKGKKRLHHMSRAARPKATCCVLGCVQTAQHHVRRKWLTKLKRSIGKKVPVINNKLPPHVPLPLCSQHYAWVDHFMICGICRRRLNCNQMYSLGPEVHEINALLANIIPVRLVEKVFICKLCRYFTSLRSKFLEKGRLTGSNELFYESYRKRILQMLDLEVTDEPEPEVPKRKRRKLKVLPIVEVNGEQSATPPGDKKQAETVPVINLTSSEDSSPPSMDIGSMLETQLVEPMIDYSTLGSDAPSVVSVAKMGRPAGNYRVEPVKPTKIRLTFGNSKPGPSGEGGKKSSNVLILEREPEPPNFTSVLETPQLSVTANFDFRNPIPVKSDAEGEWEKCAFSLQYDRDSKQAFEKLKRPYGSQSSFFRHLLLLEQYWRSGELMAAPTSNARTKSYLKSVQNRINSFSMSAPPATYSPVVPKLQSVPTSSVPIIDLPLRRLSGGMVTSPRSTTFTCTTASSSMASTSMTTPRPATFTCTSASSSMPSTSVTNPLFVSQMPAAKKYVMNPATGQYVATKRKPNIVQVTKGGQPLFRLVDPTKSQIRALQGYKRKVPTATVTSDSTDCVPLICDVRSLGEEGTKLWNTKPAVTPAVSVVLPVTSQLPKKKNAISILPKPPVVGPKPNTVLTPTGIILSKKLDVSVSPIVKKDDLAKS